MRDLLFVIPPYFNAADYLDRTRAAVLPAFTIPYGILSMEAYFREHARSSGRLCMLDLNITLNRLVEERCVEDFRSVFRTELMETLERERPQVVGVSALFNSSFPYIEDLVSTVKAFDADILTVAGGGLPSAAFEVMLERCPHLDAICKGEGERPLLDLLEADDMQALIAQHPAWIDRDGLTRGKVPAHDFVADLDLIPRMNYDFLDLDNYNSRGIDKRYADQPRREMAIHTSRGCPFLCVFCSNPSLHGRTVRFMSIERVVEDVKRMRDEFGMTVLLIEDDHFFHDKVRAKALLRALADLDIRCEFPNGLAVYAIDDEMAELLAAAGVSAVALAVESGSDYVLDKLIRKPLKKRLIRPAVQALRKVGIRSHVFIVIGLPGEMDEHREETRQMLLEYGFDWVHIYLAMPIYGSRLYEICAENGYIENPDSNEFVATRSVIRAPGVDPQRLERYAYDTQLSVNFVHNHNMQQGRHAVAIPYMLNTVTKYPDHALAHLYLSRCYRATGQGELADRHGETADRLLAADPWWREVAERLGVDHVPNAAGEVAVARA